MPVARLLIPRLGLDEVVLEGVGDDELNAGPGHLPGSALPGAVGNSIISAHRDRHFRRFDELRVGDTIRTEAAEKLPGVIAVVTGKDVAERANPLPSFGAGPIIQDMIAIEKVRHFGECVAAVIAENRYIAEDACDLIEVQYHVLPYVIDVEEAMKPDAPVLHDDLFTQGVEEGPPFGIDRRGLLEITRVELFDERRVCARQERRLFRSHWPLLLPPDMAIE